MKLGGTYRSRGAKIRDLLIGFIGWWVVAGSWSVLELGLERPAGSLSSGSGGTGVLAYGMLGNAGVCLMPLSVLVLIPLAFLRRWMALGMLTAFAANFLLTLALGTLILGMCGVPFFMGPLP